MWIYDIGDVFQTSVGPYESDAMFERDQWRFFALSFKFIVDIDANLDKFYCSQIQKRKLLRNG